LRYRLHSRPTRRLGEMQKLALAALLLAGGANAANVVIAGDSWGEEGGSAFQGMLSTYSPNTTLNNIAIGGTTALEWAVGKLGALKTAITADTTHVWLTLGGNDAIQGPLPVCGLVEKKSAEECTTEELARIKGHMVTIIEAIHKDSPKVRVLGFGYDILGMGKLPICPPLARGIFPQCIDAAEGFNTCFNTQFVRIQAMWEELAQTYDYVDTVSMLGTLEAAGGDTSASTGKPDLAKFSPNDLMQSNCIHPTQGWGGGFGVIFKKQWTLYWSKQLQ